MVEVRKVGRRDPELASFAVSTLPKRSTVVLGFSDQSMEAGIGTGLDLLYRKVV